MKTWLRQHRQAIAAAFGKLAAQKAAAALNGLASAALWKSDYPLAEHYHREALGMSKDKLRLTFQSRFGPAKWLQPYTDKTVIELAKSGVKSLAVITPGFSADCLETIEEIGVENAEYFLHNGGEKFARIDCLNASEGGIATIVDLVKRELSGWE